MSLSAGSRIGRLALPLAVALAVFTAAWSVRAAKSDPAPKAATRVAHPAPFADAFERDVRPILADVCSECHTASSPLNISTYLDPASLVSQRDGWDKILARVKAGEMPPATVAPPSDAEVTAFVGVVEHELDRLDRLAKPDPGRVTTRRLNRVEYANTIHDL